MLILVAWAASLGWLIKREYFRPTGARLAEAALAVPPGALFYHMRLGNHQVGFLSTTIDTLTDSVRVEDMLVLDVAAAGALHRTTVRSQAVLTRALRLRSVQTDVSGDGPTLRARGEVRDDTVFRLTLEAAGDSDVTRWALPRPVVVPSLLPLRLAFGGELKRGNTYGARLFDPVALAERDVAVRVGAETTFVVADSAEYDSTAMAWVGVRFDTVRAFAVDLDADGRRSRAWVDAQGRLVRVVYPTGMVIERSAFEIAYENFRHRDTARVARASAAPPLEAIVPTTVVAAGVAPGTTAPERFRLRFTGAPADLFPSARGDTVEFRQVVLADLPRLMLPVTDTAVAAWRQPDPLVPSGDPRLVAQARLVVGRTRNAARAAQALVHWVHDAVRVGPTAGVPSATAAFAARQGDVDAQAAVLVGLARASGIPARTVAGLLYADGRFYYHAWAELYVGAWVPADPLLGQFPADARHVALIRGGRARAVELAPVIGQLGLEVL
jgi:hypothetical protein